MYLVSLSCSPSPLVFFKAQVGARSRDGSDLGIAFQPGNIPCPVLQPWISSEPSQYKPGVVMRDYSHGPLGEDMLSMNLMNERLPQLSEVTMVYFDILYFS